MIWLALAMIIAGSSRELAPAGRGHARTRAVSVGQVAIDQAHLASEIEETHGQRRPRPDSGPRRISAAGRPACSGFAISSPAGNPWPRGRLAGRSRTLAGQSWRPVPGSRRWRTPSDRARHPRAVRLPCASGSPIPPARAAPIHRGSRPYIVPRLISSCAPLTKRANRTCAGYRPGPGKLAGRGTIVAFEHARAAGLCGRGRPDDCCARHRRARARPPPAGRP